MPRIDLDKILDRTREVVREVIAPRADEIDRTATWPAEGLGALKAAGLGGLVVPEQSGGLGHGLTGVALVCEEIARECASTAICFGMHCVGAAVIAAKATPEQEEAFLEPISRGEHLTTLSLSEPGTGSEFWIPQTQSAPVDEGFVVSGTKTFVTNGGHADSYVVSTTAADPDAAPGEFSCVVITRDAQGLTWGEPWRGIGMRGNSALTLTLEGVLVPRTALLGRQGDQMWYVFNVVAPYFLIAMSGTYLGVAAAALDEARQHLEQRRYSHSGSTPAASQVVQHRLGSMWAAVERTRRMLYHAAAEGDAGGPDVLPGVCSAKAEVADCATAVVNDAMTLCGGIGYRESSRLERLLRDARASHVMAPTTDVLRQWVGRHLLGRQILEA